VVMATATNDKADDNNKVSASIDNGSDDRD
jgi:hypothetical protein